MAKGAIAKENLIKRFADAVGADYVGEFDKKYYFWSNENGERVQIAVAMTCPKNPIGGTMNSFEGATEGDVPQTASAMTETEQEQLDRLMKELDL